MRPGVCGLPELSAVLDCMITRVVMILRAPSYHHKLEANNGVAIPKWRLPEAMVGGSFLQVAYSGLVGQAIGKKSTGSCQSLEARSLDLTFL